MNLDEILGVDHSDPSQILADRLVANDRKLLNELIDQRKRLDLSQREVAEKMGVTESAISKIESGSRDLRLATLRRYAHAVGVEVKHNVTKFEQTRYEEFTDTARDKNRVERSRSNLTASRGFAFYATGA